MINKLKTIFYIIKPLIYYMIIKFISMCIVYIVTQHSLETAYYNSIGNIIATLVLLYLFIAELKIQKNSISQNNITKLHQIMLFVICIILGSALSIVFNTLFQFITDCLQYTDILGSQKYTEISNAQYQIPILAGIICHCIFAPVCEEILMRGLIFNRLRRFTTISNSIIISSLIFGLYHKNVPQFIYAFIMGLILAILYDKTNSLLSSILFHIAANSTTYLRSTLYSNLNIKLYIILFILVIIGICCILFKRLTINNRKITLTH